MTLISEEYRRLNEELHARSEVYGSRGDKWVPYVEYLATCCADTVLDYGCGKAPISLPWPRFEVTGYDPARPQYAAEPEPADLVVCTDVLEHVEPEHLDAVLDDLRRLTKVLLFAVIATRLSDKYLADGRNAHLIVKPVDWWRPRLAERFHLDHVITSEDDRYWLALECQRPTRVPGEFFVVARPKC